MNFQNVNAGFNPQLMIGYPMLLVTPAAVMRQPQFEQPHFEQSLLQPKHLKMIRNKLPSITEKEIQEIAKLAMQLIKDTADLRQPHLIITKKSGCTVDHLGRMYVYQHLKDYKIHFITENARHRVTALISKREKNPNGLPAEGIIGSSRICTKPAMMEFYFFVNEDSIRHGKINICDAARLRLIPNADGTPLPSVIYDRFTNDIAFLMRFQKVSGISQSLFSFDYLGSRDRRKITSFEKLYRFGDLISFYTNNLQYIRGADTMCKSLLTLFKSLGKGMLALKEQKVIHNDLAMDNIAVDGQFRGHIRDFEYAVFSDRVDPNTAYGWTAEYLSPERLGHFVMNGYRSDVVSHASDMWAMGTIFYWIYAGIQPVWTQISRGLIAVIMIISRHQALLEHMRDIQKRGYQPSPLIDEDIVHEIQLDRDLKKLILDFRTISDKFISTTRSVDMMPVPSFRPMENEGIKTIIEVVMELQNLLNHNIYLLELIKEMETNRSFRQDNFNRTVSMLEAVLKAIEDLEMKMWSELKTGWEKWSALPDSEDPIECLIQKMLRVNPKDRITSEELTQALALQRT